MNVFCICCLKIVSFSVIHLKAYIWMKKQLINTYFTLVTHLYLYLLLWTNITIVRALLKFSHYMKTSNLSLNISNLFSLDRLCLCSSRKFNSSSLLTRSPMWNNLYYLWVVDVLLICSCTILYSNWLIITAIFSKKQKLIKTNILHHFYF